MILATAFGQNSLRPADGLVTEYFSGMLSAPPIPAALVEAITVVALVNTMLHRGATALTRETVAQWFQRIGECIEFLLEAPAGPNAEAQLLVAQVLLAHSPALPDKTPTSPRDRPSMIEVVETLRAANINASLGIEVPSDGRLVDLEKGMGALARLVELLPSTPLVPIDDLTRNFDMHAPILRRHPRYVAIRDELDDATGRVEGQAAKGDRAQARALALLKADEPHA